MCSILLGKPISVLDGVPIAVKDEIDCMPYPTTGDSYYYVSVSIFSFKSSYDVFHFLLFIRFVSLHILLCNAMALLGGTKWLHRLRPCEDDACCVLRLRSCGALLVGKTNMHELGAGTSGINPHYG